MSQERLEAQMTAPAGVTLQATNAGGGPTTVTLTQTTYYPTNLAAQLATDLNAQRPGATWTSSLDATTGQVTVACTGNWSITWVDTNWRDALGFTGNISGTSGSSATGGSQAKGLWLPSTPFLMDSDPLSLPNGDDRMATIAPDGTVCGLIGTTFFRHRNARFEKVVSSRVWPGLGALTNADWQTFYKDTQRGEFSWFSVLSKIRVYWVNAGTLTVMSGQWRMPFLQKLNELRFSIPGYTGLVDVVLGDLSSP